MSRHEYKASVWSDNGQNRRVSCPPGWPVGAQVSVVWEEPDPPRTEHIPWWEAKGRKLAGIDGHECTWTDDPVGPGPARCHGSAGRYVSADVDGLVEVLVDAPVDAGTPEAAEIIQSYLTNNMVGEHGVADNEGVLIANALSEAGLLVQCRPPKDDNQ